MAATVEGSAVTSHQQLATLNTEAQELSKQLNEVFNKLVTADPNSPLYTDYKQRYEDLKAEKKLVDQMRTQLAGGGAGTSQAGLVTAEQLKQVVIEAMQQMNKQPTQETKAFSKVGSPEATQLLQQLNLVEVDGNSLDPVHVPADTAVCSSFDYSQYGDENAGTPALLKHHQAQLQKLGVKFGRGGYAMYDLHNQSALYTIATSATTYQGNTDVCVAPFGLMVASAAIQCRVAYEHKQSPEQKQAFRDKHPTEELGQVSGKGPVRFAAAWKGQAIAATIGAYAHNNYPLMFDLTDGVVHHVLQVRGVELFEWTNLSPQQAYYMQAKMLNENLQLLSIRSLTLEAIPEQLQPPMKRMRFLRPSSALQEQLESIVPDLASNEEKLQGTLELMAEWARRDQLAMPAAVQAMFG